MGTRGGGGQRKGKKKGRIKEKGKGGEGKGGAAIPHLGIHQKDFNST